MVEQQTEEERNRKQREVQERNLQEFKEWRARHNTLIEKFLKIADRKVSFLDDYGDENWDALSREIETLLLKTARVDGHNIDPIRRWLFKRPKPQGLRLMLRLLNDPNTRLSQYFNLRHQLESEFRSYHESHKQGSFSPDFNQLSGAEFETYLAKLLGEFGFVDIRGTPVTGDQGADLIAMRDGRTVVIQAKRYQGSVGNRAVQEVAGAVNFYGADEGWVITSGTFTRSAKALAQKNNVKLIDGHALRKRQFPENNG